MNFLRVLSFGFFFHISLSMSSALAEKRDLSAATQLYSLGSMLAAYMPESKTLSIGKWKDGGFDESKFLKTKGQVFGVVETSDGLLVATGMGRGDLQAPIQITLYRSSPQQERVVFELLSERSQISSFKEYKGKIWITFFESKFFTKTGYFTPSTTAPWTFNEVTSERLGDAIEVLDDGVVVGRPYGDIQGQDGDISLIRGQEKTLLPSYRGVRAVSAIGSGEKQKLIIGDGWHQNYGQLAQARLSILTWNPVSKRYALELIDKDSSQYGFNKLLPFALGGQEYVAALGNKSLTIYGVGASRVKQIVYTRVSEETFFDVVLSEQSKGSISLLVLDKGLHSVTFAH